MLRYAEAAAGLFSIASMPTELLDVLSRAHEATARAALGFGPETTGQRLGLDDLRAFDPSTLRQAKRHLIQSASFARLHADRFLIDDYDTYADSLWRSALLSDAAGDRSQAIEGLTLFAETVQNDPRQPEARHRLGELFRARGEYKTAAGYYAGLIDESRSGDAARIGRWADLSFVPLAQCYIADVDDSNDQEAVRLLEQSIDGTRGGPERPEFREAVIELGNLAMRRSQYADAIERYEEAVARSDGETPLVGVRFRLADAYRLLAEEIEDRLDEPLSDRERGILSAERSSHLRSAIEHFGVVRDELGRLDPRAMTELQSVYLRNAHFYLGDCAFDLEQYREAIDYYDRAKSRYSGDPAVLVAMIQTVNAYIALGDFTSARTANDRAKATYQTLPDDVWDDPNLPMSRREWESWLDANTRLITGYAKGG
jgi:tetratricopeptide (TPR) repeat protein